MEGENMKEPFLYRILRPIITLFVKLLFRPVIIGKENIIQKDNFILAGNHTNYLDCTLLISSTKKIIHFMAKDELSKGVLGPFFKSMGLIFVNRKTKDRKSLNLAIEYLNNNKVIGIFPEGTINRTKKVIMPFKFGAVKMANVTNSYIVPFAIIGKYKLFRKGIKIIFAKPYKVSDDLEKENKKLEKVISTMLIKRSSYEYI